MRNTLTLRTRQMIAVTFGLLLATLTGCSNNAQKSPNSGQGASSSTTSMHVNENSTRLPPSQYAAQFAVAESALSHFDWMSASVALAPLQAPEKPPLSLDDSVYLSYLTARGAYILGSQNTASDLLTRIDLENSHPALRHRIYNFQRHMLDLQGRHLEAAKLSKVVLATAAQDSAAAVKRALWQDLQRCNDSTLESALLQTNDAEWAAWLKLAQISRGDLAILKAELPKWQEQHPTHPANKPLPGGMSFLLANTNPPSTVALILPLSGRLAAAGKAVRDGYLASYLLARTKEQAPQQVLVLDSDAYISILDAYHDAVRQGASLVVGPLSKEAVAQLAAQPERAVPILALNRVDHTVTMGTNALVQMALAPEDEATRLAELAYGQGTRRALILRPAGPWGEKIERALTNRWLNLGGSLSSSVIYTGRDEYATAVKKGMGLESSEQRKTRVRDMLATNVEFAPRRRQDVEAVFMLSRNADEARSLKPLFAFHYAGELPIYATSSVYSGSPDRRDRDLNGINLVEMPWLLGDNPPLKLTIDTNAVNSNPLTRLNALGADAYTVQSRFLQLQSGPDALINGVTGLLSMNAQLQIQRELLPATFDRGALTPR